MHDATEYKKELSSPLH